MATLIDSFSNVSPYDLVPGDMLCHRLFNDNNACGWLVIESSPQRLRWQCLWGFDTQKVCDCGLSLDLAIMSPHEVYRDGKCISQRDVPWQ